MQTNNKLRETLEIVAKQLTDATEDENFGEDVMYLVGCMRTMSQKCRAALAEPVKNCDVLSADVRTRKFIEKWEKAYGETIDGKTIIYLSSFSRWLQLPCESEVADGEARKALKEID